MLVVTGATVGAFWASFKADKVGAEPKRRRLWFAYGFATGVVFALVFTVGMAVLSVALK
jgi:hypothetical protein